MRRFLKVLIGQDDIGEVCVEPLVEIRVEEPCYQVRRVPSRVTRLREKSRRVFVHGFVQHVADSAVEDK